MKKHLLNRLRKSLPKGYAKTLAESCGCSEAQVGRIFEKTRPDNYGVIDAAIQLKSEYDLEKLDKEKKLQEAVN